MGKCCWIARLALQQHFPIQILFPFPIFKLLPNFIFQCYRPQTWQFYLCFPALSVSGIHEVLGINLWVGRSRDPQLQKANLFYLSIPFNHNCVLSYATAGKQVQCMWTNWNFQIQIQRATLKSWGFVRGKKGIWLKYVLVSLSIASHAISYPEPSSFLLRMLDEKTWACAIRAHKGLGTRLLLMYLSSAWVLLTR